MESIRTIRVKIDKHYYKSLEIIYPSFLNDFSYTSLFNLESLKKLLNKNNCIDLPNTLPYLAFQAINQLVCEVQNSSLCLKDEFKLIIDCQ